MLVQISISETHIIKVITGYRIKREVLLRSTDVTLRRHPSTNPEPADVHISPQKALLNLTTLMFTRQVFHFHIFQIRFK